MFPSKAPLTVTLLARTSPVTMALKGTESSAKQQDNWRTRRVSLWVKMRLCFGAQIHEVGISG